MKRVERTKETPSMRAWSAPSRGSPGASLDGNLSAIWRRCHAAVNWGLLHSRCKSYS